jgi:hypothetical protein
MTTAEPWKRNWDQQSDATLRKSKLSWKTDMVLSLLLTFFLSLRFPLEERARSLKKLEYCCRIEVGFENANNRSPIVWECFRICIKLAA